MVDYIVIVPPLVHIIFIEVIRPGMATTLSLTIDLRDGFYNDTVIVTVDEKEVFRKSNVTSKTTTGFADSKTIQLNPGEHKVHVQLQEKEESLDLTIEINKELFIGLNNKPHKGLEYQLQGEPFKYM